MPFRSTRAPHLAAVVPAGALLAAVAQGCAGPALSGTQGALPQAPASLVRLAPDDKGDPTIHHDYVVSANGADNVFTWIPRFTAYQLVRPAGAGFRDRPVGSWVAEVPQGIPGVDFARQEFGGFYVAKYEASKARAGSEGLAVVKGAQPWTVNWTEAQAAASAFLPGTSHLMRGDEWTALSVWASLNGVDVRGNTLSGVDAGVPTLVWTQPEAGGAALTGTGRDPSWAPGVNLASHTGREDGVMDLVGNVQEWDGSLAMNGYELVVDGKALDVGATVPGFVASLHTDPLLRQFGVAGRTSQAAVNFFGSDYFHGGGLVQGHDSSGTHAAAPAAGDPVLTYRGARGGSFDRGHHDDPTQAGMWLLCVNRTEDFQSDWMGFRPALRY